METFYITSILITLCCIGGVYFMWQHRKSQRDLKSLVVTLIGINTEVKKSVDDINAQLRISIQNGDKNSNNIVASIQQSIKTIEKGLDTIDASLKETIKLD